MGKVDTTLFRKTYENDLFIVQIYLDDINKFLSTNKFSCQEFSELMRLEFEMMTAELHFFLGI